MLALRNAEPKKVRPTRQQVEWMHKAVQQLHDQLFKQRFGREPEPWSGTDTSALDKTVQPMPAWTTEEVLDLVRSHFESAGIQPERPYLWFPRLGQYYYGPLAADGIPKQSYAAMAAETASKLADAARVAAEAKAAEEARDTETILRRAQSKVMQDLRSRGFDVFTPLGPASYEVLATRRNESGRTVRALRIRIVTRDGEVDSNRGFYSAVVSADPDVPVSYQPALEEN
jgi:hypothetical protein